MNSAVCEVGQMEREFNLLLTGPSSLTGFIRQLLFGWLVSSQV